MIKLELTKDQISQLIWLLEDPSMSNVMLLPAFVNLREAMAVLKEAIRES